MGAYSKRCSKVIIPGKAGFLRSFLKPLPEADPAAFSTLRLSFQTFYGIQKFRRSVAALFKIYPQCSHIFLIEFLKKLDLGISPSPIFVVLCYTRIVEEQRYIKLRCKSLNHGSAARSAAAVKKQLGLIGVFRKIIIRKIIFFVFKQTFIIHNHNGLLYHIFKPLKMHLSRKFGGFSAMTAHQTPMIFDTSDGQELRINTINTWLKKKFGHKIVKLSLDGGFTCPNRDGSKGTGGCVFCSSSGSGDMAAGSGDIIRDLNAQIDLMSDKWPNAKYIAYFQSHTNTYAPADELREKFFSALSHPDVTGIAIATRPDCIQDEVLQLLSELRSRTFMWVELGLQTIHEKTAEEMNLCYTVSDYDDAVSRLLAENIPVVTHLIMGLPGETQQMMLDSVRHVCEKKIFGIKLHMLNLVKGSQMEFLYPDYVSFESIEDYIDLVISAIEIIPPDVTLHRISGDAPRSILISPEWSYKKRTILNGIHSEMRRRNTWQGKKTGITP